MNEAQNLPPMNHQIQEDDDEIDLGQLVGMLWEGKWITVAVTAAVTALGIVYALLATPIYQADALIQVEKERGIMPSIEALGLSEDSNVEAEIQLLRSRMVIGRAVDERNLVIQAEPLRFPAIGGFIARRPIEGDGPRPAPFGLRSYAWGGERIDVPRLVVPDAWLGEPLTLITLENGRYELRGPDGSAGLTGQAGEVAARSDGAVRIFVRELFARPGTEFTVVRRSHGAAVRGLQSEVQISESGRGSGVLRLSLEGEDHAEVQATLSAIANAYVRQNVERRSQEAEQRIAFLDEQLPEVRRQVEGAEQDFNRYRQENEAFDLSAEGLALLEQTVDVEERLAEITLKRSELSQNYASQHPRMIAITQQEQQLRDIRSQFDSRIQRLPESQQQLLRLQREVEVTTAIYTAMLNQAQELRVVRAGTVGNVRIVDEAATLPQAVKPQRALIAMLSVVLGGMLGLFMVVVRNFLRRGITNPAELENRFGLSCYAVIPQSPQLEKRYRASERSRQPRPILARDLTEDSATESLRSLRTSLHFALMNQKRKVIAITGPSPGVGKTFLSINLAYMLAQAGKRVLVIDADLRRGHMHVYVRLERGAGLSDVIAGEAERQAVIETLDDIGLAFMSTGTMPPNPSELLMSERFDALLRELEPEYDLIILDTAPVLAATDGVLVSARATAVFMLLRAGAHPAGEIDQALKRLQRDGVAVSGFIMNGMPRNASGASYGGYYHYNYDYAPRA
ncbi:MAG: polysaccharide biosynthesis tyrosine autokinase [Aquisalimonadaceae bacterium]